MLWRGATIFAMKPYLRVLLSPSCCAGFLMIQKWQNIARAKSRTNQYPFIGMSHRTDAWTLLRENFQDDPTIVEAIDSWFDKNKVDTMVVARAALVGCTPKGKTVLIETLSASASFPHWS